MRNHKNNPAYKLRKRERYKAYRHALLQALAHGPLRQCDLQRKMGLGVGTLSQALICLRGGARHVSQLQLLLKDLLDDNIIEIRKLNRKVLWGLARPAETPISTPVATSARDEDVESLFLKFMSAVKKEAERSVQHKINAQAEACKGYVKLIQSLQAKLQAWQDENIVSRLFNFKNNETHT